MKVSENVQSSYTTKDNEYFSYVRRDVITLLPIDPGQKVLEIGAGGCNTLLYIKENNLAKEVMGIDLVHIPGSNQQHVLIDKFQVADMEKDSIAAPDEYFDVIICADILEHLRDPWSFVEKISRLLKKGGRLIVSIPNIREWKTLYSIVFRGDFRYDVKGGILDSTHLRFFCKKNIRQLLNTGVLSLVYCKPNFLLKEVPQGKKRRILNRLTGGLFLNFLAIQYLCIAEKK